MCGKVIKAINISIYKLSSEKYIDEYWAIDNIISEINAMKTLNNTKVSKKMHDYWMSSENGIVIIYIMMDFKGISLQKWKMDNIFTEKHKETIEEKIKIMHNKGIIHKDLHDNNILVNIEKDKPEFYITDFGLSKTKQTLFEEMKARDYMRFNKGENEYFLSLFIIKICSILDIKVIET